ncbi:MerR family transcriptional regulator [Fructilactobacillus florum]|uniref:MerR family transcriptional regulator n=1 Tax=Fructilactobacillus florum TaxID=640331 RepID=UPI0020932736|nr:MerR family transcriptional regulator [Fructilactobacillus florum]
MFRPQTKSDAGYRYYDYRQLYDLLLILGLRNLGLSLAEIQQLQNQDSVMPVDQLLQVQTRVAAKIKALEKIQHILDEHLQQQPTGHDFQLYQPQLTTETDTSFWCSNQSAGCSEAEVAELFSDFYNQLDELAIMETGQSGFLTDLPVTNPTGYKTAAFRVIKQTKTTRVQPPISQITKPAGQYATIMVENNLAGITRGLTKLAQFTQQHDLKTTCHLWQLNSGAPLVATGASRYGWLEYELQR